MCSQLWNIDSRKLVASFPTLDVAVSERRMAFADGTPDWIGDALLVAVELEGEMSVRVAEGDGLLAFISSETMSPGDIDSGR